MCEPTEEDLQEYNTLLDNRSISIEQALVGHGIVADTVTFHSLIEMGCASLLNAGIDYEDLLDLVQSMIDRFDEHGSLTLDEHRGRLN